MNQPFRPFRSTAQLRGNDAVGKVVFAEGFMSDEECDRILALADAEPEQPGRTGADGKTDEARDSHIRFLWPTPQNAWLFTKLEEAIMRLNQQYAYELTGFYEGAQVARYAPGGHYDWHVDLGEQLQSARKLSVSVQLTDGADYQGGDFRFSGPTDEAAPRSRGSLIAFPSFVSHRVEPVTQGERRSLVSWISGPPFR